MSNIFVAPKGNPPAHFKKPENFPKYNAEDNNTILKVGMNFAQPETVYDLLVVKKGQKPLATLLMGDVQPYSRFGASKPAEAVMGTPGVGLNARSRDTVSANLATEILDELMGNEKDILLWSGGAISVKDMEESCKDVVAWRGPHVAMSFGRLEKYLPNAGGDFIRAPSAAELAQAFKELGYPETLPGPKFLNKYEDLEPFEHITWNPKATAGLPYNCQGDADPDVFVDASRIAEHILACATEAFNRDPKNGVKEWYRKACLEYPGLFSIVGKAKTEDVTFEKAKGAGGRFYNATPLHFRLLLATITQVFEENCRKFGPDSVNSQGVSFMNSGADVFMGVFADPIDEAAMLGEDGINSTNCGDDSFWGAYSAKLNAFLRMAFDMSSFDLTQKNVVLRPVVEAIGAVLATSNLVLAQLFVETYLHRPTLVGGLCRVLMNTGGPSGTQLQSKVNGALMRVFLNRFNVQVRGKLHEEEEFFQAAAVKVAAGLGLVVKLEQFRRFPREGENGCPTFTSTLAQCPFLYLGYFLWQEKMSEEEDAEEYDGTVYPFFDIRRAIPSLAFPKGKYKEGDVLFNQERLVRMVSLYFTFGVPPKCLEPLFDVLYEFCMRSRKIMLEGGTFDPSIRAHYWENVLGAEAEQGDVIQQGEFLGSLFEKMKNPDLTLADVWTLDPHEVSPVPLRHRFGPFMQAPRRLTGDKLPRPRPELTRTPVSRANFGRPPPISPWAPPALKARGKEDEPQELSSRALRKEHLRFAEAYQRSRVQDLGDEEEFARPQKGRRRGRR